MKAVSQILEVYALGRARVEPLESADNDVFRIEAAIGRRFVLRVHHGFAPLDEVMAHAAVEIGWLEHIRRTTDLVVPRPVRLPDGEPCGSVDVEGRVRAFTLFEWIEGEPAGRSVDRERARRMGRSLAELHQSSRDFAPAADFCAVHWDEVAFFGPDSWIGRGQAAADLGSDRFDVVRAASQKVRASMQALGRDARYYGLIHSDPHADNMLITNDAIAVLDFSDCGWGYYLFDVGVLLADLELSLNQSDRSGSYAALRGAVLAGYEEVARIPSTDAAPIEAFVALRDLASLEWIGRSPDPEERRSALRTRPGIPFIFRRLEVWSQK